MQGMEPLIIMYGRPKKVDAELTAWWLLYYEALSKMPRIALDYAASEYIRTSTIHMVPAPGILTKLAEPWWVLVGGAYHRCKRAVNLPEPPQRVSKEEREWVKAQFAAMRTPDGGIRLPRREGPNPMFAPPPPRETRQQAAQRFRTYEERRDHLPGDQ